MLHIVVTAPPRLSHMHLADALVWLILSTIRQNGDIVLDTLEFCYCFFTT